MIIAGNLKAKTVGGSRLTVTVPYELVSERRDVEDRRDCSIRGELRKLFLDASSSFPGALLSGGVVTERIVYARGRLSARHAARY